MGSAAKRILDDALLLPAEERAELVARLLESLDDGSDEDASEVEREWEAEIERRREDVRSGKVDLVEGEELLRELRARQPKKR